MRYIPLLALVILIACTCIIYAASVPYESMRNTYPFTNITNSKHGMSINIPAIVSYGRTFLRVNWVRISVPSPFSNFVYGSCILGRYVIFVGSSYETYFSRIMGYVGHAHIEVRYRSTGELVNEWTDNQESIFYNCITVGDKIYVVGGEREPDGTARWVIYVFDKNLHVLRKIVGVEGVATSIVTDGKYVYIGGWEYKDGEFVIHIEKRRLDDLALVKSVDIYHNSWFTPEVYLISLYDMAINPVTGDIWAVGHYYSQVNEEIYGIIIILDKNLNIVKEISYPQVYPKGICFNSMGRAYVVTPKHVLSFSRYETFMGITNSSNGTKILCIGDYVITFSYIRTIYKTCFAISLLDSNLNLLGVTCLGLSNFSMYGIGVGKPAFDGSNIYVGFIGDGAWVLYSLHVNITRPTYGLPDLTVRDLEIYPQSPVAGQTVTISFKICNIGSAPASNVEWILYINNITYEKGTVSYIAAGTCVPENVTVTLEGGEYNIKVIVNPYNTIRELNITNNIAQEKIYVRYRTYKTYGNWILLGNATVENGNIVLTQDITYQIGAAWYMIPINFSYNFYAKLIVYLGSDPYGADGITFVISRDPLQIGGSGGSLGYAAGCWEGTCFHGILNSIAIEIDTFQNIPLNDPYEDHIAIDVNASVVHTGKFPVVEIGNVEDGKEHVLEIFWNAKNRTLTVKFDGKIVINNFRINLYKYIKGDVGYIAVTGATGAAYNLQYFRPVVLKYTMASVARVCLYKLGSESLYTPPNLTELGKFIGCTYVSLRKLWFWITFCWRDVPANWTNVFAFVSHDVDDDIYTIPPPWARKLVHNFREVALDIMFGINVTVPGKYLVETYSDDGVWVKIDNDVVIQDWTLHAATYDSNMTYLSAGVHRVEIKWFNGPQEAILGFRYRLVQPMYRAVVFVRKSFNITLRPVFGYRVEIPIKNVGNRRICVWLSVENPYTDIRVGFVGLGVTEPLCLNPGEVKYATLIIYAQNAKRSIYSGIKLLILNINRSRVFSTAFLTLRILFPKFNIKFNIVSINPYTLAKTITITNLGGPITGLSIIVIGNAYVRPQIRDYYLPHGASLTFTVIPILYEGFTQETVTIVISAFNGKIVKKFTLTFKVPPGKHVYGITLRNVEYIVTLKNYECLNVKHIILNFTLPRLITKTNVKYVYLIMQFVVHWSSWPFTTTITINGVNVGKVPNQVPSGYYIFEISKNVFKYGGMENIFEIYSDGMNPGDYITTGRIKLIFYVSSVNIYVVASSVSEAHKAAMMIARSMGIVYAGADVAVFKNAIDIVSGSLICGKTVKLMIKVYNLGTESTGRVRLVVYSGNMILATTYLTNIPPGSYSTATLTITIPSNAYTIRIVVYSSYDMRAWDNSVELTVKHVGVALPDLAVSNLMIIPPRPTTNSTVIASYEICNYGNKNAYNVEYVVELDGKIIQDVTIPQISSYECTYYYTVLGRLSEGWHTVTVIVDPHNKIKESNENNNRMQIRFYVSPIVPTCRIEITSRSIVVGEIASIRIWLVNCPSAASLDLELRFNPYIINVVNITPGPFKEAINDVFVTNINNTKGILAIAIAGTSPCNKYRILVANVTIKGVHIGETRFVPVKAVISDIEGRLHKVTVTGGIIKVVKLLECDFNHNGKLDIGDVVLLLKIILGTYHSNVPCDLNHNGKIDIGDAVLLLRKILKTLT